MYDMDSVDNYLDFPEDFRMDKDMQRPDVLEMVELKATERKRGRPKKEVKCVPVPISMRPELKRWIDECSENRSKFVCEVLEAEKKLRDRREPFEPENLKV